MNSSAYVFGNLGGGFTQYPEDYAHEIYEEFQLKAEAPSQVIIHRDKSIMYYGYIRKLDGEGQYIGLCVLLNGVMLSKMSNLFSVFEKVVSEMVSQGELIKMDDNGDIIGVADRLDEKQQEVERIVTYLREEVIHWESAATKLPPISYSISNDSSRTFSLFDKDEDIVEASVKYSYICVQKNEGYDTPLLAGFRNVLKKQTEKQESAEQNSRTVYVEGKQGRSGRSSSKKAMWIIGILVLIIALMFVFVPKNCFQNQSNLAVGFDTVAVDSVVLWEDEVEANTIAKAVADSIEVDNAITEFITDMYNNSKYEDYKFLRKHCSSKMIKILRTYYDYECDDGDCYAVWLFRSGAQDGVNNLHKIISVKPQGEHWYKYDFYDMGIRASNTIKVVKKGNTFVIDDIKSSQMDDYQVAEEFITHNWFGYDKMSHHIVGTMKNDQAFGRMELRFVTKNGGAIEDVIYKNLELGGKIRMQGSFIGEETLRFVGKDGPNDFIMTITDHGNGQFVGSAIDGENYLIVDMEAECDHY